MRVIFVEPQFSQRQVCAPAEASDVCIVCICSDVFPKALTPAPKLLGANRQSARPFSCICYGS